MSLLRSSTRPHRRDILLGTVLGCAHQICEAGTAVVIGEVIDDAVIPGDVDALLMWLGILLAVFVVLAVGGCMGYYRLQRAEQRVAHDIRVRIAERVVDERGGTEAVARTGEVLSLSTSDAGRVGFVALSFGSVVSAVVALAAGGVYLFLASWELGLLVLVGLPLVVLAAQRFATPLIERSEGEQTALAYAAGVATDLVAGLRVLKGIGAEIAGAERYRQASDAALDERIHAARYQGVHTSLTALVNAVLLVAIAWIGGRLAMEGTITVGQLVVAVGMIGFLVWPLQRLTRFSAELAVIRASARRIEAFLQAPPAVDAGAGAPAPAFVRDVGTIRLNGVRSQSLRDLALEIAPGEWLGVVATDQRDALALVDLLARRVDPDAGTWTLGGVDARGLRLGELRRAVVVADHDAVLFDGTVAENVTVAAAEGIDVGAVMAATAADEVTSVLAHGHESAVGEGGRRLSGGQRQRVALARAAATEAEVLVLHEPTTAVDAATEASVAGGLRELRRGRTTVVVTTSPAWLDVCDRVVVVRHGAIVAEGRHRALAHQDEDYRAAVLS